MQAKINSVEFIEHRDGAKRNRSERSCYLYKMKCKNKVLYISLMADVGHFLCGIFAVGGYKISEKSDVVEINEVLYNGYHK